MTTDLIVGFPGETDRDFEAGLAFVEEMRFAHAHVFPFSARPGTAATSFGEEAPSPTKRERRRRALEVVAHTGRAERLRFAGTGRPVLWEGEGRPLTEANACVWTGLTDNYLRVMAEAPPGAELKNTITRVHLGDLRGDTFFGTIEPACG